MYSGEPIEHAARRFTASLLEVGLTVSATVRESEKAIDLALLEQNRATAVVRCVEVPRIEDVKALRVMIAQGDFHRAFLVHTGDETDLTGDIQTWPVSRIDELAALLAKESAP